MKLVIVLLALSLAACMNSSARSQDSSADLHHIKIIYVRHFEPDKRGLDAMIASDLRQMGYQAISGGVQPENVDAVVTYRDKWRWDMTNYMISLSIKIRDPKTDFPLAEGNSMHTSLTRKSPNEMIQEVLNSLFGIPNEG